MFKIFKKAINWNGKVLELETGKIARQATASVVGRMGDTVVLCTVVCDKNVKEGIDFFPLTVNYIEKFYAMGKIPGGFNKRESKPSEHETLVSRLIDRPIRPLFPKGFFNEVNVVCTVLSYDKENEADIIAMVTASAALAISGIPFLEPIAAARVSLKDGQFILNPSFIEQESSMLDLVVAGTESSVLMIESEAKELSEEQMLEAVMFAHANIQPVITGIKELANEVGNPKWQVELFDNSLEYQKVEEIAKKEIESIYVEQSKQIRREKLSNLKDRIILTLVGGEMLNQLKVITAFKEIEQEIVRNKLLREKRRIDGRSPIDIRSIACELDILPRTHGSALFTRGETQAICVTTLGTSTDEQMVDTLHRFSSERFMLHYNFPPYSVGEVGQLRAPGRREIGHGKLAFRALCNVLPSKEEFPYTIRMVSDITESNGSSSMATVCGCSLALMAAGVPIRSAVSGIAMGLIKEGDEFVVLSDILGDEDHLGDMDFKVAGTKNGVTSLQMDIKINGINRQIMQIALEQAKAGRAHILSIMNDAIERSRTEISKNAPAITTIKIDKDKIREVIGSGGKVIRDICEKSGAKIDIMEDGTINIASITREGTEIAMKMIEDITTAPEVGKTYQGVVIKIIEFGAIVKFLGNSEGMIHISNLGKVSKVSDAVKEGQQLKVKIIAVDNKTGKTKLSLAEPLGDTVESSSVTPSEQLSQTVKPRASDQSVRDNRRRNREESDSSPKFDNVENTKKKKRLF